MLNKQLLRIIIASFLIILLICFFWKIRSALFPFYFAFFLVYLLNPSVCYFERKGISRVWGIIIIYLLLAVVITALVTKILPILMNELNRLSKDLPKMIDQAESIVNSIQLTYQNTVMPEGVRQALDEARLSLERDVQEFIGKLVNGLLALIRHFIGLALSPILAFYILADWTLIKGRIRRIFPISWHDELRIIIEDMDDVLSGVIRGQLSVAAIVFVLVTTGLWLLQVDYAISIGLLAGMLDIIPYFGAIAGALPGILIAGFKSPVLMVKVAILFFIIQQLEGECSIS